MFPVKSSEEIKRQMDIIDLRMKKINADILNDIKSALCYDQEYICETFRPQFDCGFILIRRKNEKSDYVLNIYTMKPTKNSPCQKQLPIDIILQIIE